jgi:excisionase family DNA binding protein
LLHFLNPEFECPACLPAGKVEYAFLLCLILYVNVLPGIILGVEKPILTVDQAAELLQVDPNTIYRWARAGKFPASKIGKEWRVLYSDVLKFIESKKAHHQFFTAQQEAELVTSIIGRREIPLKFEYFGEGADGYINFPRGKEVAGESEYMMMEELQSRLAGLLVKKKFNLLDLGPGDGRKAAYFISHTNNIEGYFPLDISKRMLEISSNNIKLAYPELNLETFNQDFEQGNIAEVTYYLHRRYQRPNLLFFLGNTIGNISDAHRLLINMSESMTEEDLLLVGLAHYNPKNIPLNSYNIEEMFDWLGMVARKIGIKNSESKIYWTFNKYKKQLECQLEFTRDWSGTFAGNVLTFIKGQKLLLAISRRFSKDNIFELFAQAGFKVELLVTDEDKDHAFVLCRPFNWEKRA